MEFKASLGNIVRLGLNTMLKGKEYSIVGEHLPGNHKALSSTPVLRRIKKSCPHDRSSSFPWDSPSFTLALSLVSHSPAYSEPQTISLPLPT